MRKKFILIIFAIFLMNTGICQTAIEWSNVYGGSESDKPYSICNAYTSGYLIAGKSESQNGDITDLHVGVGTNIWITRIGENGTLIWNKSYGSRSVDELEKIIQTKDNGYIFVGSCGNNTIDVSGMYACADQSYWLVKIDSSGNIIWQKNYGVCGRANAYDIIQCRDSSYLIVGRINWGGGDAQVFHGIYDIWICKISSSGDLIWNRTYGGSDWEDVNSICETTDGNYVIVGSTLSNDFDVSGLHGNSQDVWAFKIDTIGNILWQKCFGGSTNDFSSKVIATNNNEVYIFATTTSSDGDVTTSYGSYDIWIFRCDSIGNISWQGTYGGPSLNVTSSAISDVAGGFLVLSKVSNDGGMVTNTHGLYDYWLMKIDSAGNFIWGKALGGSNDDVPTDVIQTPDGGFLSVGYSYSSDGDVPNSNGNEDFWAVKMESPTLSIKDNDEEYFQFKIFQLNSKVAIQFLSDKVQPIEFKIYDILGRELYRENFISANGLNSFQIDSRIISTGVYIGQLTIGNRMVNSKCFVLSLSN